MNAPQSIQELIPRAYSWKEPRFARFENGLLIYQTTAYSNAGGSTHHVYFPVDPGGRTLNAQETWEVLEDDATRAVENKKIRFALLSVEH
jgi:hypothetical protein